MIGIYQYQVVLLGIDVKMEEEEYPFFIKILYKIPCSNVHIYRILKKNKNIIYIIHVYRYPDTTSSNIYNKPHIKLHKHNQHEKKSRC